MFNTWFRPKIDQQEDDVSLGESSNIQPNVEPNRSIQGNEQVDAVNVDNPSHHDKILSNIYEPPLPSLPLSTSKPENAEPKALYDPFTGKHLGIMVEAAEATNTKKEELWTHLSRVMLMQQTLSESHMEMEGIGGERRKHQRRTERASEGEDEGVQENKEAEEARAREEEFAKLTSKFDGRKEVIDQIMGQLDDLSRALTTFHALETPMIDFAGSASRNNSLAPPEILPLKSDTTASKPALLEPMPVSYTRSAPASSTPLHRDPPTLGLNMPGLAPSLLHESPTSVKGFDI